MEKTMFRAAVERWDGHRSAEDHNEALELLREALGELAGDELDVVGYLLDRARVGKRTYSELKLDEDPRDFVRESLDEMVDGLFYLASFALKVRRAAAAKPVLSIVARVAEMPAEEPSNPARVMKIEELEDALEGRR